MPRYEYHCDKCDQNFDVMMSMSEHDEKEGEKDVHCPACHGTDVEQQYSVFYARTSKKS